jgi:putative endonuclease
MNTYSFGIFAEYLVAFLYFVRFYKILGHRLKTPMGEIDLVALRGRTIIFIEVKARMKEIDEVLCMPHQQDRIRNAATLFLQKHSKYNGYDIRFDLCVVRPYRWPKIIKNAW